MLHPTTGTGREGQLGLESLGLAPPSPLAELPGVSGSQLGLPLPGKDMRATQPLGTGLCLHWCEEKEAHVSAMQS